MSSAVAERISSRGIEIVVQSDDDDDDHDVPASPVGVGVAALAAGGLAYHIAKNNGSKNAQGWAVLAGLTTLFLSKP